MIEYQCFAQQPHCQSQYKSTVNALTDNYLSARGVLLYILSIFVCL